MKEHIIKNITDKADALAVEYDKTKDPLIREEWYRVVRSLDSLKPFDKNILHKVPMLLPDQLQKSRHQTK